MRLFEPQPSGRAGGVYGNEEVLATRKTVKNRNPRDHQGGFAEKSRLCACMAVWIP